MRIIVEAQGRNSQVLQEHTYRWPSVPRLGEEFVFPETDEEEQMSGRIKRVIWWPLDLGDDDPTVRVVVYVHQ